MTDPAAGTASVPQTERNPLPQRGGDIAEEPGSGPSPRLAIGHVPRCLCSGSVPTCRGVLPSRVGPRCYGDRPPVRARGDEAVPEVAVERLPCRGETLTSTAKRLQEMSDTGKPPSEISDELPTEALPVVPSREPSPDTEKDLSRVKLPPWLGKWGTSPEKESPSTLPPLPPTPPTPPEKPSQPQQRRVTQDWQKEVTP